MWFGPCWMLKCMAMHRMLSEKKKTKTPVGHQSVDNNVCAQRRVVYFKIPTPYSNCDPVFQCSISLSLFSIWLGVFVKHLIFMLSRCNNMSRGNWTVSAITPWNQPLPPPPSAYNASYKTVFWMTTPQQSCYVFWPLMKTVNTGHACRALLSNPCSDISVWPQALRYLLLKSQWVTGTNGFQLWMSGMWTVTYFGKREGWSLVSCCSCSAKKEKKISTLSLNLSVEMLCFALTFCWRSSFWGRRSDSHTVVRIWKIWEVYRTSSRDIFCSGGSLRILPALSGHLHCVDSPFRKSPSRGPIKPAARRNYAVE